MNEEIKVQIGEPEEKSVVYNPKMKMALRKTLSGDYAILTTQTWILWSSQKRSKSLLFQRMKCLMMSMQPKIGCLTF